MGDYEYLSLHLRDFIFWSIIRKIIFGVNYRNYLVFSSQLINIQKPNQMRLFKVLLIQTFFPKVQYSFHTQYQVILVCTQTIKFFNTMHLSLYIKNGKVTAQVETNVIQSFHIISVFFSVAHYMLFCWYANKADQEGDLQISEV